MGGSGASQSECARANRGIRSCGRGAAGAGSSQDGRWNGVGRIEGECPVPFAIDGTGAAWHGTVLEGLEVRRLNFGVIANVTAEMNRDAAPVKPLLLDQIVSPVRWEESMDTLARMGIEETIELAAGGS